MLSLRISSVVSIPTLHCDKNNLGRSASTCRKQFFNAADDRFPVTRSRGQSLGSAFTRDGECSLKLRVTSQASRRLNRQIVRRSLQVVGEGANLDKVIGTVIRTGREGLASATNLVPESVPRPAATAGVVLAGFLLFTFVLKALFNTLLTLVVVGGLGYGAFVYFTRSDDDSGGRGGSSSSSKSSDDSDSLDEARRIMEKYK